MSRSISGVLGALAFCAVASFGGCSGGGSSDESVIKSEAPGEGSGSAVWLEANRQDDRATVRVMFRPSEEHGARVAEHFLRLSTNLTLEGHAISGALSARGKELVVQDDGEGRIRVVMYSLASLTPLPEGELYELTLRKSGTGEAKVAFDNLDQPMFAPPEAVDALRVGGELKF